MHDGNSTTTNAEAIARELRAVSEQLSLCDTAISVDRARLRAAKHKRSVLAERRNALRWQLAWAPWVGDYAIKTGNSLMKGESTSTDDSD